MPQQAAASNEQLFLRTASKKEDVRINQQQMNFSLSTSSNVKNSSIIIRDEHVIMVMGGSVVAQLSGQVHLQMELRDSQRCSCNLPLGPYTLDPNTHFKNVVGEKFNGKFYFRAVNGADKRRWQQVKHSGSPCLVTVGRRSEYCSELIVIQLRPP